jgi:predicted DNA-binding protein
MGERNPKAMTLRLPPEQAEALEAAAQVNGVTVAEEVRTAIWARLDALRADPDFQARLREHLERNREILKGLAST